MAELPLVRVLTTGGTIASAPDEATGAMRAATSGEALIAAVPGLQELASISVDEVALIHSWDMTLPMMADLARRVDAAAADGIDGVVITHGTDTMEETAFAIEVLSASDIPTVVTGSMRAGGGPASDGPRNLLSAVRVAASPESRDLGCVVVLNDEIHAAREVHKTHTTALDTFASPATGRLGTVDDLGVLLGWKPRRRPPLRTADGAMPEPADVGLVWAAAGLPPSALDAAGTGMRGVVIAGSGSGNVPGNWLPAIRSLMADGVPVVLSSRCETGRVVPTYGGDGGGRTLTDAGAVPAGNVPAVKARILLAFALGAGLGMDDLRTLFDDMTRHQ